MAHTVLKIIGRNPHDIADELQTVICISLGHVGSITTSTTYTEQDAVCDMHMEYQCIALKSSAHSSCW